MRTLRPDDLPALVAIDAALSGRSRQDYFERRLAAARRDPERHLQLAIFEQDQLAGFMLGRALEGEFGRSEPEAYLEAFGVRPASQGRGVGAALEQAFEQEARRRGVASIRTAARWREHELLRFLDHRGFSLVPAHVLERATSDDLAPLERDALPAGVLQESDLEGIARIDRRHTGRERRGARARASAARCCRSC